MAVKIRLRRMGQKKAPFYRIVVADSRYPRDGRFIEQIGHYNPMTDPAEVVVDAEKALSGLRTALNLRNRSRTPQKAKYHRVNDMPELKQLLTDISRAIVDCPDSVTVDEREEGDTIVFTLHVTESDMGKVIGKHGKNARSIRAVMKAAAATAGKKAVVDIAE